MGPSEVDHVQPPTQTVEYEGMLSADAWLPPRDKPRTVGVISPKRAVSGNPIPIECCMLAAGSSRSNLAPSPAILRMITSVLECRCGRCRSPFLRLGVLAQLFPLGSQRWL